jgi:biopolymer transport protein ExbB/TolQ
MIEIFLQGGVLFMSIITIFLLMVGLSFYTHSDKLKTYGNLALSSGILGSFIGLYSAFMTIQEVGNVSPAVFAGGLRVALTCTLYGLLVYIISRILYLFR